MKQKQFIQTNSDSTSFKKGDHIFIVEFVNDEQSARFEHKEFIIDDIIQNNLEIEKSETLQATIHNIKFPNIPIHTDISIGYFKSLKEGKLAFYESIKYIFEKVSELIKES